MAAQNTKGPAEDGALSWFIPNAVEAVTRYERLTKRRRAEVRHGERGSAHSGGDDPNGIRRDAGSAGSAANLSCGGKVNAFVDDRQRARLRPFQHAS